jgi:glycosyltransferase involved in cell wall biosynthesis
VTELVRKRVHVQVNTIGSKNFQNLPDFESIQNEIKFVSSRGIFDFGEMSGFQPFSLSYITSTLEICKNFDIIHIHDSPKICNDLLILLINKLRSITPVVFTPHGAFVSVPAHQGNFTSSRLHKLFSEAYWSLRIPQMVLKSPDQIIAVNSIQEKIFTEISDNPNVTLIHEAIPSRYFVDKPTFTHDNRLKLLFIGRISEEKGIKDLLLAIHKIIKTPKYNYELELVCIGPDYGHSQEIKKIIDNLELNRYVRMLGSLSEEEKIKYLTWCDVLVLPSYFEAFGLPILEAMAQGKPVIASDTIGGRSLVRHEETGFLVKVNDPDDIARKLIIFLENSELKYQMGEKALKNANNFRMEKMVQDHIALYQKLVS